MARSITAPLLQRLLLCASAQQRAKGPEVSVCLRQRTAATVQPGRSISSRWDSPYVQGLLLQKQQLLSSSSSRSFSAKPPSSIPEASTNPQTQQKEVKQQQQQQQDSSETITSDDASTDAVTPAAPAKTPAARAAAAAAAAAARPDLHALRFPSVEAAAARVAQRHELQAAADAAAAATAAEGPPSASLPPSSPRLVTWRVALLCSTFCGLATSLVLFQTQRRKNQKAAITESITVGKPLLGGPWTLVDGAGALRSDSDFRGKYQLVYFGFSFCPDICPKELEKLSQAINIIDKEHGEVVQPIFITVDPARDTVAQVAEYCKEFHPRLLGLTGTPGQIKDVTRKFRVYFNETARTGDEEYLVDHSIIQYFMGRDGKFKDFFGQNMTVREVAQKISQHIKEDKLRDQKKKRISRP